MMKEKRLVITLAGVAGMAALAIPVVVSAQVRLGDLQINPAQGDLLTILARIVNVVLLVAGILAFFYMIYGGFLYLTAGGEPTKASSGVKTITNAAIGIIIIALSYALVTFVIGQINSNFANNNATSTNTGTGGVTPPNTGTGGVTPPNTGTGGVTPPNTGTGGGTGDNAYQNCITLETNMGVSLGTAQTDCMNATGLTP